MRQNHLDFFTLLINPNPIQDYVERNKVCCTALHVAIHKLFLVDSDN